MFGIRMIGWLRGFLVRIVIAAYSFKPHRAIRFAQFDLLGVAIQCECAGNVCEPRRAKTLVND